MSSLTSARCAASALIALLAGCQEASHGPSGDGAEPPACGTRADCAGDDEPCALRACIDGACGWTPRPDGTPTQAQVAGDCRVERCDGAGNPVSAADDTDLPLDGNPCTLDRCDGGAPSHPAAPAGTACGSEPWRYCDGAGACIAPCAEAAAAGGTEGCEFWFADLDAVVEVGGEPAPTCAAAGYPAPYTLAAMKVCVDASPTIRGPCAADGSCAAHPGATCELRDVCVLDLQHRPFEVVVANPGPIAAHVTLEDALGATETVEVAAGTGASLVVSPPRFSDLSLDSTLAGPRAYRLHADVPVAAWRYTSGGGLAGEGTLLLPTVGLSTTYRALTTPGLAYGADAPEFDGYLAIVAQGPGTTVVSVTPAAAVRAGGGVPALPAGVTTQFVLEPFGILNLAGTGGADLSGTAIESDRPVAVFAGHEADGGRTERGCCHGPIEEQAVPNDRLGSSFALLRSPERGAQPDRIRLLAPEGATITWSPLPAGAPAYLGEGQVHELELGEDTTLVGTGPLVVQRVLSRGTDTAPRHPAMTFAVPTSRFRTSHLLVVPDGVDDAFLSVVRPAGGTVAVDGTAVGAEFARAIDMDAAWLGGHLRTGPGLHRVQCDPACGAELHGFGAAGQAFAWPAGFDLR